MLTFESLMPGMWVGWGVNNGFWHGEGLPTGKILFGTIGEETPTKTTPPKGSGVYEFTSSCGIVVYDAHILSADADTKGGGDHARPRPGSTCIAVMTTNGAQCFIIGFLRSPIFDDNSDDPPTVGAPADSSTTGDKVYKTAGGATLLLKRGGAVILEGGAGASVLLNPINNQMSLRASNLRQNADGYLARRGRVAPGSTDTPTTHEETFLHQVGPTYDRFRLRHGTLPGDARRQLELSAVRVAGGRETATVQTRETYHADGHWVGEGPKYQWGGADANEPAVLGHALVEAISKLIDIVAQLKVGTAWGPSTPPLPPTTVDLAQLKAELSDKILSTFAFFAKKPADL